MPRVLRVKHFPGYIDPVFIAGVERAMYGLTIDLPSPPTANTYWRRAGHRIHLSKRGQAFKSAAYARWLTTFCSAKIAFPDGDVRVSIAWRRARKIGDTDNIAKPILDALKRLAFTDDNQVTELHITRTDDKANPGVTVTISRAT